MPKRVMEEEASDSQSRLLHWEWSTRTDKVEKANKKREWENQSEVPNNSESMDLLRSYYDKHFTCIDSFTLHTSF